jgi:hypothetical protein
MSQRLKAQRQLLRNHLHFQVLKALVVMQPVGVEGA